ncbi:MAG: hypothetical protein ACKOET_13715, partial [Verrucomicrobiota bacterium]
FTLVSRVPELEITRSPDGRPRLAVWGRPGLRYEIQVSGALGAWRKAGEVVVTRGTEPARWELGAGEDAQWFRVVVP